MTCRLEGASAKCRVQVCWAQECRVQNAGIQARRRRNADFQVVLASRIPERAPSADEVLCARALERVLVMPRHVIEWRLVVQVLFPACVAPRASREGAKV